MLAGTGGTVAMTLAYAVGRRLQPRVVGPLDYDDGLVPGQIVAAFLRLEEVTDRRHRELGLLLRWGYGSALGIAHGALRRGLREPRASVVFAGLVIGSTFSLFPILGKTPPPWRWGIAELGTCVGTHAAYVAGVAACAAR
jgi:hypothetical protein